MQTGSVQGTAIAKPQSNQSGIEIADKAAMQVRRAGPQSNQSGIEMTEIGKPALPAAGPNRTKVGLK